MAPAKFILVRIATTEEVKHIDFFLDYGHKTQTEDKSWFPKASTWKTSGWDHGYWTADNETWYQDRLQEIQDGRPPMNAKEWREFLKRRVRPAFTDNFKKHVSDVCDKFLQGDPSYWMN